MNKERKEKFITNCFIASLISLIVELIIILLLIGLNGLYLAGLILMLAMFVFIGISVTFLIISIIVGWKIKFIKKGFSILILVCIGIFFALLIILPNL